MYVLHILNQSAKKYLIQIKIRLIEPSKHRFKINHN